MEIAPPSASVGQGDSIQVVQKFVNDLDREWVRPWDGLTSA